MIGKYYKGVIEQVYSRLGEAEQNIVMAQYSNDFSVAELGEIRENIVKDAHVFFACHEFSYHEITSGYAPFLSMICQVFRMFGEGDFDHFLEECGVYVPHREVLDSYYRTGHCKRTEMVLLDEVEYEQRRMSEGIAAMLRKAAKLCPILLVVNRFQLASRSAMELVCELLLHPSANIGIVLGANEKPVQGENILKCWDKLMEALEDRGHVYHIGNSEMRRNSGRSGEEDRHWEFEGALEKLRNTTALLDYDQAACYFQSVIHRIQFEGEEFSDEKKLQMYPLYVEVSVLRGDFARALEINKILGKLKVPGKEKEIVFASEYYLAVCQMYQGKLEESDRHSRRACRAAEEAGSEKMKLKAELLNVQIKMAGWHNLLFCLDDIEISEEFLEKLMKYGYKNNLAHIYVYAYDNKPEEIVRAYQAVSSPSCFNKGIALAREIGNDRLIYNAYQKNIMISVTNGYYEASMFYLMKNYQLEKGRDTLECGRTYSAIGYNFSALGRCHLADIFYKKALKLFLKIGALEDIAEVHYNMSLNGILTHDFAAAEHYLQLCMKTIEKLGMNSLRVCNLSKLYGLQALVSIMQKDKFSCQRYLLNGSQFLIFMMDKESNKIENNHDYAKLDDDLFLYWFSKALLEQLEGENEKALRNYENAEKYLAGAKSNQFYVYRIFCEKYMELLTAMKRPDLCEKIALELENYIEYQQQTYAGLPEWILKEVEEQDRVEEEVSEPQIEVLVKQESLTRRIRNNRHQMEFLSRWQKIIDVNDVDTEMMVANAMNAFLTQFGNDGALYIRYDHRIPRVVYNDADLKITEEGFAAIERSMQAYPQGFAVSKISGNFSEHLEFISYFNGVDLCSLAAVPFFKSGRLESVVITYILMKGNWHSSMESYRISEEDLPIYQLLFREMGYSINRMEAYEKIYEMNQKLAQAATTDTLTGIYNRTGFYREIRMLTEKISRTGNNIAIAVMFIDLDNFKHYNDTYGHDAGDMILKFMADIFREILDGQGIVSRYGGDEFLIILQEKEKTVLEKIAGEIYRKLEESEGFSEQISELLGQKIRIDQRYRITCSIGIAINEMVRTEEDINELIKEADRILYSIKGQGKGTYAFGV